MVVVGLSWLVYWLLANVFNVEHFKAALATGLIFLALGLVLGEKPWVRNP